MKTHYQTIKYTCPNPDCEAEVDVEVEDIVPARISGPPEDCYPESGGDFSPYECPECKADFAASLIHEIAFP